MFTLQSPSKLESALDDLVGKIDLIQKALCANAQEAERLENGLREVCTQIEYIREEMSEARWNAAKVAA